VGGDDVVERQLALDGPERELLGERAVARVQAPRLAVKRAVGVCPLLEYPPNDGERGAAGGAQTDTDTGSGRTSTVSATGMISSTGRSARPAWSRIASGLEAG
jgi:hypothetical protein